MALLKCLFEDIYDIQHVTLDAVFFALPVHRRRLYCVLTLRGHAALTRPLRELPEVAKQVFPPGGCARTLFSLPGIDDCMSAPVLQRADQYIRTFGEIGAVYDLDQLPHGRPRRSRPGEPLFTLTAHTRLAWCAEEGRALRRNELALGQGLRSHSALGCVLGSSVLDFEGYSRSCAARLIRNGMALPCIGAVLYWCSVYVAPSLGGPVATPAPAGPRADIDDIRGSASSADGASVVTASRDGTAKIWSSTTDKCLLTLDRDLSFPTDGDTVVTAPPDDTAKIWNSTTDECLLTLAGTRAENLGAAPLPDVPIFPFAAASDEKDASDGSGISGRATWKALGELGRALCVESDFGELRDALLSSPSTTQRLRDLFPLPVVPPGDLNNLDGVCADSLLDVGAYPEAVVVGLNWLYGVRRSDIMSGARTAAQAQAHKVIIDRAIELHQRLAEAIGERTGAGWDPYEAGVSTPSLQLKAEIVAVPDCAARCDPRDVISGRLRDSIMDASAIFPAAPQGLEQFFGFHSGPRCEYVALTVRQIRAGLLRLATECKGGGTVFPVAKSGGSAQRLVWHGTRVSKAAAHPPAPRHLADPSAFGMLDLSAAARLRVTKRNCKTWFDQLAVDRSIGCYFGRPRILRSELIGGGLTPDNVRFAGGDDHADSFYPCSCVWPMGFSWSSCVAQETLLGICGRCGLESSMVLASDTPLPETLSLAFAVATDDLMVFSDSGPGYTTEAIIRFESALSDVNVLKNPSKDIDDTTDTTCVGVDLVAGTRWCPPADRLWSLLDAAVDLGRRRRASPGAVAAYWGVAQWYNLLRRLRLSIFRFVYDFSSRARAKDWGVVEVDNCIVGEVLI